jgi:hypothetical protein
VKITQPWSRRFSEQVMNIHHLPPSPAPTARGDAWNDAQGISFDTLPDRRTGLDGTQEPGRDSREAGSTNKGHRRHLTPGQRAALALALRPHLEAEARRRQQEGGRLTVERLDRDAAGRLTARLEGQLPQKFGEGFDDRRAGEVSRQLAGLATKRCFRKNLRKHLTTLNRAGFSHFRKILRNWLTTAMPARFCGGHRKEETLVQNFAQGFGDAASGRQ